MKSVVSLFLLSCALAFGQENAIVSIGGPSSVKLGGEGDFTVSYTADPDHNITVTWSFNSQAAKGIAQPAVKTRAAGGPIGSVKCSYIFNQSGPYQVQATVTWDNTVSLYATITVNVIPPTVTPTITVDSPTGADTVTVNADGTFAISFSWQADYVVEWPWAYLVNTQDPTVAAIASDDFANPAQSGCGMITQNSLLNPGTKLAPGTYWIKIIDQGPDSPLQNPITGWSGAFAVVNAPTITVLNQPVLNTALTTQSQYVAGGVPNATRLSYDFSVSGTAPITITEMDFAVTGGVVKIGIGGSVTAGAANGAVKLFGLNTVVYPSPVANLNLLVSYGVVGIGGSVSSGTPAQVTLVGVKYVSGSVTQTLSCKVTAPPITLVGSFPTVSMSQTSPATGTSGAENRIGTINIAANATGAVKVDIITFGIGSTGVSIANMRIVCEGMTVPGSSCGFASNGAIACNLVGYPIAAGQTATFDLYATCTGTGSFATSLNPLDFIWDDVAGSGTGLTGRFVYGWPTNSFITTFGAGGNNASGPDATVKSLTPNVKITKRTLGYRVVVEISDPKKKHVPVVEVDSTSTTTAAENY